MIQGVYVANVTPFDGDGEIDTAAYFGHVEWLAERGVQGIVPFGTNGEGPSIGMDEKLPVLEALFALDLPLQIIPCVGQSSLPDTLEMVRALQGFPAEALLVMPPYFFKPPPTEGLRRFFDTVVRSARHPVIVYHIPQFAVAVPAEVIAGCDVWGVKDSGADVDYGAAVMGTGKKVLFGSEHDLWRRLSLGAPGMITALGNFMPEAMTAMYGCVQTGDAVEGPMLSERIERVQKEILAQVGPAPVKRLAEARHGLPMGGVRPPLIDVEDDFDAKAILDLTQAG
ncbi:MAG: dihydrodipicolinate synthase family protein [Actinobacteria bacterium]|nr:dihydrodipicolinate synthase family protein [Actinomycetota bacterium]